MPFDSDPFDFLDTNRLNGDPFPPAQAMPAEDAILQTPKNVAPPQRMGCSSGVRPPWHVQRALCPAHVYHPHSTESARARFVYED